MQKKEVVNHIVSWLLQYSNQSKTNGFVVGISGGIDSALTSTLCAKTGKPVICLNMPIHQIKAEYDRGNDHIQWLEKNFENVSSYEINLTETFKSMSHVLPSDVQDWLTMANTRSRIRMTTLYAVACNKKMLVTGTGNKVEDFGVGFFTKYGDGGVDLSPIADLMKSEVYALAKELGVINAILQAKPTDGLFADGRSDEDQIGASYDELEWAMNFVESKKDKSSLTERQQTVLAIYTKMNTANQHKMNPIPVCMIPDNLKV
jgi:NAD+ synthase